ncbi:hypothetical protein KCH_75280 [Kitasatospora cheerisanensis KCTC 2395]|uniref:Uncharacterized protein n=1 Tax=Kitasatospora cheerisanensis KCTC 2395 TaxID=1348663 RepID=A0A066YGZ4_9ACTN|nr:hypothetical protein KCH_75280 [Kitasatospora cheerisanensis KCTC 2395]
MAVRMFGLPREQGRHLVRPGPGPPSRRPVSSAARHSPRWGVRIPMPTSTRLASTANPRTVPVAGC